MMNDAEWWWYDDDDDSVSVPYAKARGRGETQFGQLRDDFFSTFHNFTRRKFAQNIGDRVFGGILN